jgi:hypothetical protein
MSTAYRIGPREAELILLLARYVRARVDQLTRHSHSPNSVRAVRKRLNGLVDAGYVDISQGFSQDGKPPFVYSLSMRGWRYAEEQLELPIPARWRPSEAQLTDYRDYLHALAITDLGIAIERFCREADPFVTFVQFLHDRFLPQTRVLLPDTTSPSIRLDAWVELHIRRDESSRKRQRCHLIEIDRGTHYEKALRKKVLTQIHYVKDGHYQRDFGTESLSYLWVCPGGAERVRQLLRIVEATLREQQLPEFAPLFLFTAENPATADPVHLFTRPCWFVPFEAQPVALLTFPAQAATVRLDRSHYLSQDAYDQFLVASGEGIAQISPERELA